MADKLIGSIFTRAKNAQARSYATTSKNVARLMLIFRRTIDALTDAVDTGEDPMEALDASVGWNTLLKARPEVATIAETANLDPLTVAADRYATLRKFAPDLLQGRKGQCKNDRRHRDAARPQQVGQTRSACRRSDALPQGMAENRRGR